MTLLQKEFWDEIKADSEKLDVWTGQRLVGVDRTPLQIFGVTQVQFRLAGAVFTTSVICGGKVGSRSGPRTRFLGATLVYN